jgi:Cof subfamily protein (haloacid dehalogenase superfamily)
MGASNYDALCLDLDGTLLTSRDGILPEVVSALHAAQDRGVVVMVVTGRSKMGTLPVLEQLDLRGPVMVFNGAAVYCPVEKRLIEERTLSRRVMEKVHAYGERSGDMTLMMSADEMLCVHPRNELERRSLDGLEGVRHVEREELRTQEYVIRVSFMAEHSGGSANYVRVIEEAVGEPLYTVHFPLSFLPKHRESSMQVVDLQPPCRGKAEALRLLQNAHGIPPERVVAVGDARNDTPLIQAAGLGVAMENSMEELKSIADRIIGHHDTPALAELVQELFL